MKLIDKGRVFGKIMASKTGLTEKPVAARWVITNRCGYHCSYCNTHEYEHKDMPKEGVDTILKKIQEMGIDRISISGGEPLIADHFSYIVDRCREMGISPIINTSGFHFDKKIETLKKLDLVQFSCDGPEEVMTKTRDDRAYKILDDAVKLAVENDIKFSFACTMTKYNTNPEMLNYMLDLGRKHDTVVAFQPLKEMHGKNNDCQDLMPHISDVRESVEFLINEKKKGNKHIRNSLEGLKHIRNWPSYEKLFCTAGKLFIIIMPNGSVVPCDRLAYDYHSQTNLLHDSVSETMAKMESPSCEGCGFCGATELNHVYSMNFSPIKDLLKL